MLHQHPSKAGKQRLCLRATTHCRQRLEGVADGAGISQAPSKPQDARLLLDLRFVIMLVSPTLAGAAFHRQIALGMLSFTNACLPVHILKLQHK